MNKGIVYGLYSENKMYFGSTTMKLNLRLNNHKAKWNQYKKGSSRFNTSFLVLEQGDYKIEIIEICNFDNVKEMLEIEQYYIKNYPCVNKAIPLRTQHEYYLDNREKIRAKRILKHERTGRW